MADDVLHLAKSVRAGTCDITDVWCGPRDGCGHLGATEGIERCTCIDCLTEAVTYGNEALARRGQLQREKGGR